MLNSQKESSVRIAALSGLTDTIVCSIAAATSNSSLLLADALKTGLEFMAVLLAWMSIRRITRGAGQDFEFGIGKLENLASLVIGSLMVLGVAVISFAAIRNIIDPTHATGIGIYISLADQVVYGVINGYLMRRAAQAAKHENSPIMASQAKMFFAMFFGNVFIFITVSLGLVLHQFSWSVYIDPLAALVVAATIVMAVIEVFSTSCYDLLDGALAEEDKLRIMRVLAENFDRYDMIYSVRSRRSGSRAFIEIYLGYDAERRVGDVEREIEAIRSAVAQLIRHSSVIIVLGPEPEAPEATLAAA
jgi:cation diffusion facilitator family transporter